MKNFDLNTPLMKLSGKDEPCVFWTVGNAVEGSQIFGGTGAGKTSGSGRKIAMKFLKAGFGGLVLTVKPDERKEWEENCEEAGRRDDLIIVGKGENNYFNFLNYESREGQSTTNIVQVLKTVIRAGQDKEAGKNDDSFWETSLDMLITHVIDLCILADGKVSVERLYDVFQSLPKLNKTEVGGAFFETFVKAKRNVYAQLETHNSNQTNTVNSQLYDVPDARILKFIDQFLLDSYLNLSEKTRSIVDFSFSGFLFQLLREPIFSLFCHHPSNFTPEDCLKGKIILLDLPVKVFHKAGRDCQILFKYIWQRAMEKRDVKENGLPVFLWADEAQNFLHEKDTDFQATARSSRVATVYITQNLPNYLANMGGARSDERVKSFLGTLGTKIFHANVDVDTNNFASEIIGDTDYNDTSTSASTSGGFSSSQSKSLRIDRKYRPEFFARLKTGSSKNDYKIEAVILVQGQPLEDGKNYKLIHFTQKQIINN